MADEDVQIKFGASLESFNASMAQVRETLQGLTEPLRGVRDNLGEVAEAFIAAFAIEKIADFVKEIAELGEQAERTSQMLGLTVQEVTDLQFAATVTGGSSEGMTRALEQLERAMSDVHNTSSIQYAAFQSLGISTEFLKDHQNDLMGVLEAISQRFAESADGPAKTAIAMALLGRAGAEMIPLLNQGAEGFAELKTKAEAAGVELSGPTAEAMAKTADNNNQFGQALQGLGEKIFTFFEPAIDSIVTAMTQWTENVTSNLSQNSLLSQTVEALALAFDVVIGSIEMLIGIFEQLWTVGEMVIQGLEKGLLDLAHAMNDAVTLHWTSIGDDLNQAWTDQVNNYEGHLKSMEDMAKDTVTNIGKMFDAQMGINDDTKINQSGSPDDRDKQTLKPPGQNLGGAAAATDKLDAARAEIDGEIAVLTAGLSRKQALLNSELQMHQISEQQWVQQSEAAVDDEYAAEVALLQKELQLNGLKLTQRQELLNKLKVLEEKHAAEIQKIQQKSAQDQAKSWQSIGDSIASAMNSQVSGLLKGTESLGQAIENIGLSLASTVIENAIKSLMASAATTFGGIFAFLSPTMGPAAAAPAAAGQAAVMAAAGGIASLDVGTWSVPRDMMANIHAGETVMPAFESGQFRAMVDAFANGQGGSSTPPSGGDTHNHFHGAILDGRELLRQIRTASRLNPSLAG